MSLKCWIYFLNYYDWQPEKHNYIHFWCAGYPLDVSSVFAVNPVGCGVGVHEWFLGLGW